MDKNVKQKRRKKSIRKKIFGTADRPRMCIHKSNKNLYVQVINDTDNKTICGLSTMSENVKGRIKTPTMKNISSATILGEEISKAATPKGVKKVVFDRSGYIYHGVVKAFCEAARKGGLEF